MRSRLALGVAGVGAWLACVGCPGSLEDPGRFTDSGASCPDVVQDVFVASCSIAGCHTSSTKTQGLDLESPDPASRLVGVAATEGTGLLIDPSNPANSVVYSKLGAVPPFGSRMPYGRPALPDATIACVLAWVTAQTEDGGAGDGASAAGTDAAEGADSTTPPDDASGSDASEGADTGRTPMRDSGPGTPAADSGSTSRPDASARDSGSGSSGGSTQDSGGDGRPGDSSADAPPG